MSSIILAVLYVDPRFSHYTRHDIYGMYKFKLYAVFTSFEAGFRKEF